MNTASTPGLKPETIERLMHEHDELQDKIRRIHGVLSGPEPGQREIEELLREFITALLVHFSNEEDDGFFAEVSARAPQLADAAAKLCVEHRELLKEVNELCRFATAGSPSMLWWRELECRCHEFNKRLMNHESQENKLLHEAHKNDVGVDD